MMMKMGCFLIEVVLPPDEYITFNTFGELLPIILLFRLAYITVLINVDHCCCFLVHHNDSLPVTHSTFSVL